MFGFSFLEGFFVFFILFLFLIFYFKTSKNVNKTFYPLMFFRSISYKSKKKFFLKYFLKNKYFWIQLLILFLLLFSFLKPYFLVKNSSILNNNIIIVDTSASTKIVFDKILNKVKKNLGVENSIILSGKPARFFLEDSSYQKTLFKLSFLKPEIKSSDLDSAFILAYDKIKKNPSKKYNVIFVTDLKSKLPSSYFFLKSKNISLSIIPVSDNNIVKNNFKEFKNNVSENFKTGNIGFVDYYFENNFVFLKVKNFNDHSVSFTVKNNFKEEKTVLKPFSFKILKFPLNQGKNIIMLYPENSNDDFFSFDNTVYFFNPSKKNINVLLVTTKNSSVEKALKSVDYLNVNVDKNKLGIISKDYDVIILYEYNTKLLLPSFFNDVKKQLSKGAVLVIGKNDDINDLKPILPFKFFSKSKGVFKVFSKNNFVLNKNVVFSSVKNPFNTFLEGKSFSNNTFNSTLILAFDEKNNIIVSFTKNVLGKIVYFGYDDNDVFKNTPYFPIFFSNLLDFSSGINDFYSFNTDTNRILNFDVNKKIFFSKNFNFNKFDFFYDKSLNLKDTGFYSFEDNSNLKSVFAVNFFDEEESDPKIKIDVFKNKKVFYNNVEFKKVYLNNLLLFLIIFLLFLEVYFMKKDLLL